ncbi:MAG: quinone oxidoreductase, partial [Gammaproteobacteria bacterium]|nr:quinone oxidoreductase [Gammaproteobacteria bacterium]
MVKAIRVHETGGVDALVWEEVQVDAPGAGEVLLRHTAVGLNYIDVYFRAGGYPAAEFPFTPGFEAAGVVEALGPGVTEFAPGDRVAYASRPIGAYSEQRVISADRLVKVPDSIDDRSAAAMMLKGMTAHYLLRRTYNVKPGDTILFHAAAGGVGLIACQWAKHLGATVIGTVGSREKAELAAAHGCDHPVIYTESDFVERVREITNGQGVPVVYDAVGKDTFDRSIRCLRKFGLLVSFGQASGKIPPFDPGVLSANGSLYLTRPTLFDYIEMRADLIASAGELFETVMSGGVRIE